jgi:nucleotidyltransferase substrate binding protein (TIGR01987 family)
MRTEDIRWQQRFSNYKKAFSKLEEAVETIRAKYPINDQGRIHANAFLDEIMKEGVIQRFKNTHELAWNVMKDFLQEAGNANIFGSKDATREAFAAGLIMNGEVWMDMIGSRNKTSHTYNEATADAIFLKIVNAYTPEFSVFKKRFEEIQSNS